MKKIILIAITMSCAFFVNAQDFVDNALLFSNTTPGGSARIRAMGGVQNSLGGDYSSAYSNPAGLGMYNRSEFTISPGLHISTSRSTYFGEETDDSRTAFNIPGFSLVFHNESGKREGFLGGSFAISLNRVNDFNQRYSYSGTNTQSSIAHMFVEDANGIPFDPYPYEGLLPEGEFFYGPTGLAFNQYIIDTIQIDGNPDDYYYDSPLTAYWDEPGETGSVRQFESSERSGGQYQWSFAYGANFSDKVFVGATLGLTTLRFKLKQTYRESDFQFDDLPPGYTNPVQNFELEETYDIRGSGLNFGLGVIYRPINFLQLGASIQTPTIYGITDTYSATMSSAWEGETLDPTGFKSPLLSEYNLRTPMRVNTGATFISKVGFISADVEFINYSQARYTSTGDFSYTGENSDIKTQYQSAINYRLGGEYRFDNWRARAGVGYMSDPIATEETNRSQTGISGGFGYRDRNFFIDFAANFTSRKGNRFPYSSMQGEPVATQKFNVMSYMVTVGFPF